MKMLLCSDVRLNALSLENLEISLSHKWQAARDGKFEDLIDAAAQRNAGLVALFGRLFGQDRVSESVIDALFQAARRNDGITLLAFLNAREYRRISYRNDIPENLRTINTEAQGSRMEGDIALNIHAEAVEMQPGGSGSFVVKKDDSGVFMVSGVSGAAAIPSFEPTGFADAEDAVCGYGILEWTDEQPGQFHTEGGPKYAYRTIEVKIQPADDQQEILRKINHAIRGIEFDTFLRIAITGRSAFGLTLNGDALKRQLQSRVFHAEVYDNTVMDIDEEAFENDISLRSEFVRLALQDGSLSESERNHLISCGWNALSGKEVSAE